MIGVNQTRIVLYATFALTVNKNAAPVFSQPLPSVRNAFLAQCSTGSTSTHRPRFFRGSKFRVSTTKNSPATGWASPRRPSAPAFKPPATSSRFPSGAPIGAFCRDKHHLPCARARTIATPIGTAQCARGRSAKVLPRARTGIIANWMKPAIISSARP